MVRAEVVMKVRAYPQRGKVSEKCSNWSTAFVGRVVDSVNQFLQTMIFVYQHRSTDVDRSGQSSRARLVLRTTPPSKGRFGDEFESRNRDCHTRTSYLRDRGQIVLGLIGQFNPNINRVIGFRVNPRRLHVSHTTCVRETRYPFDRVTPLTSDSAPHPP